MSGIVIKDSQVIEECILFGFPSNSDVMKVPNRYILYAKYDIYIKIDLIITLLTSLPA